MADELDGLLARVDDPALRADLRAHIDRIRAKRSFGLVFESHLPERVRLPEHPVRAGTKVVLRDDAESATYEVHQIKGGRAVICKVRHPDGSVLSVDELGDAVNEEADLDAVVVIADFGEPVYPGLRHLGSVERGGDKPSHVVIKGENHHVLEALQFSHAGKVDCIYIDPPYNTGARDWKYDNNYVDDTDAYRHSKWLAFMERRLQLAKELLRPDNSILIVTIDEKEYLRLGSLLEQIFVGCEMQKVSAVVNRAGSTRGGRFTRVDEYVFYVFLGESFISPWVTNMMADRQPEPRAPTFWFSAIRVGTGSALRVARPNLFYAVHLDSETGSFHSAGAPLPVSQSRSTYTPPQGTIAMWPLSSDEREQTWRFSRERMEEYFAAGTARFGQRDDVSGLRPVTYLRPGTIAQIESGVLEVTGRTAEGALELQVIAGRESAAAPATVWNVTSHYARDHGSKLNSRLIPGRNFPYPKSLYAVEDALRFAARDKADAIVLDFFGGSGTTTHAVARLNRQDGGRRQSIVVTNNEVSANEATSLRKQGFRPGDREWEALGIFDHITRPRIAAAITGLTPEGAQVKGEYRFTDEFPMAEGFAENVEFMELTYLDADDIELDLAFAGIAPLLWLRAGGRGPILDECLDSAGRRRPYAWTDQYGVLFNPDRWRSFVRKLPGTATTAFVVTDSQATFSGVAAELPDQLDVVRLYENYLTTFRINEGYA